MTQNAETSHPQDDEGPSLGSVRRASLAFAYLLPLTALLVPVLYFVGRIHHESYWHEMRVPPGLMTYTFEDYVYGGFVAVALSLIRVIAWMPFGPLGSWLLLIASAVLISVALAAFRKLLREWLRNTAISLSEAVRGWRSRQSPWNIKLAQSLLWVIQWLNGAFLGFLFAVLMVSGAIVFAAESGKQQARADRANVLRTDITSESGGYPLAYLKGRAEQEGGVALGCSSAWCAIASGGRILAVPSGDIQRFEHCVTTRVDERAPAECGGRQPQGR